MTIRIALLSLLFLLAPCDAEAAGYLVRPGDTLGAIASRYHVSVRSLAHVNGIRNPNYVPAGRLLVIPSLGSYVRYASSPARYRVRWGDTLTGVAVRFHTTITAIRARNPYLGAYLIAGQTLTISGTSAGGEYTSSTASGNHYVVRVGDNLSSIASRYRVSLASLMTANHLMNPNIVVLGSVLTIPSTAGAGGGGWYSGWSVRSIITRYALYYGLAPSLPMAVADEESGFNESAISRTGAIGVMQVEPYTAAHINSLLGLNLNMYNADDNIHAGVYWLAVLMRYYGGNERLAVAAYYEGTRALAHHGMYRDTVQYVNNVMALQMRFAG
jgi:LysM repeat protein